MKSTRGALLLLATAILLGVPIFPSTARAHCDGLDGPVVNAARKALETGQVTPVLIWVRKDDEAEVREAFDRSVTVGKLGVEARELAQKYFFETVVRLHRISEGAPYTGLKPAGRDLGPAIPSADEVLKTGDVEPLVKLITDETRKGLADRFSQVVKAARYSPTDVRAGREYVRSYVVFIHYAERAYEAASRPVEGHFSEEMHAEDEHEQ